MDGDIFTSSEKNFFEVTNDDDNFFMQPEIPVQSPHKAPRRHLNDYDFNILKEDAYKDVADELFKLEYKIARAEDDIRAIDAKISAAIDISDTDLAENLSIKKRQMQKDLNGLVEIYNEMGISAKLSGGITSKIKDKLISGKNILTDFGEKLISKLPGKFSSFVEVRQSLKKLENINKSVDELMTMHIPYGESGDKYERLSKYIIRANNIQSEISKLIK